MFKQILLAGVMSVAIASAAQAALVVNYNGSDTLENDNDFKSYLNSQGLHKYTTGNDTITITEAGTLKFYYLASESDYVNSFHYDGNSYAEDNNSGTGLEFMFEVDVAAGPWAGYFTSSGRPGEQFGPASPEFAVLLGYGNAFKSGFETSTLWLALDDQDTKQVCESYHTSGNKKGQCKKWKTVGDDNHDDFIIKVKFEAAPPPTEVPEPAMLGLLGLGLAGLGMARRRRG